VLGQARNLKNVNMRGEEKKREKKKRKKHNSLVTRGEMCKELESVVWDKVSPSASLAPMNKKKGQCTDRKRQRSGDFRM